MWGVENEVYKIEQCGKCGVWKMWSVGGVCLDIDNSPKNKISAL